VIQQHIGPEYAGYEDIMTQMKNDFEKNTKK
jgi:hypothetical protein